VDDPVDGVVIESDRSSGGGGNDRSLCVLVFEGADLRVIEKPFRVGLRLTSEPENLWKTGPNDHKGQVQLSDAVSRHDQCTELDFAQVLHLIDAQRNCSVLLSGSLRNRDKEVCQVDLKVPAVGKSSLWLDRDFEFLPSQLHCAYKAAEGSQRSSSFFTCCGCNTQGEKHATERGHEQLGQPHSFPGFD